VSSEACIILSSMFISNAFEKSFSIVVSIQDIARRFLIFNVFKQLIVCWGSAPLVPITIGRTSALL
jgi:hypothetical protein